MRAKILELIASAKNNVDISEVMSHAGVCEEYEGKIFVERRVALLGIALPAIIEKGVMVTV